jgi:RNA 2',3'-cyclic 3'-phosphodiesterase
MRLFLAINLPAGLRKALFELAGPLSKQQGIRLVMGENIHITLKFLGDVEQDDVGNIISALDGIGCGGIVLDGIIPKPFNVSLEGLGAFPSLNNIRVVWAGCREGADGIVSLHETVEARLPQFPKDRDFHPHATLARFKYAKEKKALSDFIQENKKRVFGSFELGSFELMKSELSPDGASYGILESFRL